MIRPACKAAVSRHGHDRLLDKGFDTVTATGAVHATIEYKHDHVHVCRHSIWQPWGSSCSRSQPDDYRGARTLSLDISLSNM